MLLKTYPIIVSFVYPPNLTRLLQDPNGTLYTVASCGNSYNRAELYTSNDDGVTWSQEIIITAAELEAILGGTRRITHLAFAVDSLGDVHVVILAYRSDAAGYPIVHMKRTGGVWSIPTVIDANGNDMFSVAVDSNDTAHIAWSRVSAATGWVNALYYNNVTQGGVWSGDEVVQFVAGFNQEKPVVKVGPSPKVHVCWTGEGHGSYPIRTQLRYRERVAGVWGGRIDVTDTDANHDNFDFTINLDSTVHFIWHEPGVNRFKHKSLSSGTENCTETSSYGLSEPEVCITKDGNFYLFYFELITPSVGSWYYAIRYLVKMGATWNGPYTLFDNPDYRDAYPKTINDYYPLSSLQNVNIPFNPMFVYYHSLTAGGGGSFNFAELIPDVPFVKSKAFALAREEL